MGHGTDSVCVGRTDGHERHVEYLIPIVTARQRLF